MFRDFHLVEGPEADYLFFPESVKFYTVPKELAPTITGYLAGGDCVPPAIAPLLEKEEALAREAVETQRERLTAPVDADSLCFYMAHDCNLACTYCYNKQGHAANPLMMMTGDVVDAAMRRWFTEPSRTYAVSFYGGEPLLNFRGMKEAVALGKALEEERGIKIIYSMTTNGTVLSDEIVAFIDQHVSNVTVSLDGPQAVHDRHRLWQNKSESHGTYQKVVSNLNRLRRETRAKVTLKGTLAGDAVDLYEESLQHLRELDSNGVMLTPAYTEPGNGAAIDDAAYSEYVRRYAEQSKLFFTSDDGQGAADGSALDMVANLLTRRKFTKHCDAGTNPAVTADGSLYACHGLVGVPEFYMGKLGDGREQEMQMKALFDRLNVCEMDECRQCWVRYLCGGSCYAHAYFNTGSVHRAEPRHCELAKKNAETVIVQFMVAMADPEKRARVYRAVKETINPAQGMAHG